MLKLLFLFIFVITGCGTEKEYIQQPAHYPGHYSNIDPELRPYVYEYDHHASKNQAVSSSVMSEIKLVDGIPTMGSNQTAGICLIWHQTNKRVIEIRSKVWFNITESQKKALMFHELGHCTMGYGHRSSTFESGGNFIKSIMHPVVLDNHTASNYWVALVHELFNPAASSTSLHDSDDCELVDGNVTACEARVNKTKFNGYVSEVRPVVTVEHLRHEPFISISFEAFVAWIIITAIFLVVFVMFIAQNIIEPLLNKERIYEVDPIEDFDLRRTVRSTRYKKAS